MMLTEICGIIHNYFCLDADKHPGEYTISGGAIAPLDFLSDGQYFRIVGSKFNDGVWQNPAELVDETFTGSVWAMHVPPAVVKLDAEISEYAANDKPTGYTSESFAGYSYSKATNADGTLATWETVFAKRLNQWRKIRC